MASSPSASIIAMILSNSPKRGFAVEEAAEGNPSPPTSYSFLSTLLPVASLLLAACFAWLTCPIPRRNLLSSILWYISSSWPGLVGVATLYVVATLCVGIGAVVLAEAVRRARGRSGGETWQVIFHSVAATLCLPPLLIAAAIGATAIAIGLTVVLGTNVARLLMIGRQIQDSDNTQAYLGLLFGQNASLLTDIPFWRFGTPFVCAILFQVGTMAAVAERRLLAAGLLGAGAAMLTWYFPHVRNTARYSQAYIVRRTLRLVLLAALVVAFTMAGMLQYMTAVRGSSGGGPALLSLLHLLFHGSPAVASAQSKSEPKKSESTAEHPGVKPDYSGVILVPDAKQQTELVVPQELMIPSATSSLAPPPEMPFTGVYWIFKPPNIEPPKDSAVIPGSPDKVGLHSSDRIPIWMEAHQYLGRPVDLNCCSTIQVVIGNRDRYPETVSVQLLVANTQDQIKGIQSLGAQLVKSNGLTPGMVEAKDASQFQMPAPVEETLSFDMPQTPAIQRFDEIIVRFHLYSSRSTVNARMAVERFRFTAKNR